MCGIAGFTHLGQRAPEGRMAEATRRIHHRGPDQSGVHEDETVSLGAVRLRIIDLAGGEQPIYADHGDAVIVFNGEVYNHAEVRQQLEAKGRHIRSHCDTEVVLHAYLTWGTAAFEKLRGMFAAAIWVKSRRELLLVRDRLGIKPLYLFTHGKNLFFASELKSLFVHPELPRRLSKQGVNRFLNCNYIPKPFTGVEGVTKLEPGSWLRWQDGRQTQGQYWQPPTPEPRPMQEAAALEELDALLHASLREHLLADVPLGIWSSGGIDSTTVLHYAAANSNSRLKSFSVGFAGRSFDETPYFRRVAEQYGTEHNEFNLDPEKELAPVVELLPEYLDEPSADAGALPVWFLSKMSRQQVTVALAGDGGDELFGGYYTYLADRYAAWARWSPACLRRAGLHAAQALLPVSDDKIAWEYKVKRFLEGTLLPPWRAHLFWNGTFPDEGRLNLLQPGWFEAMEGPPVAGQGLADFMALDQQWYLGDDILTKCDRMSMAHSLEVRPPLLDHRLVEFAARLPLAYKIAGGNLKVLLKRLLHGKVPQELLTRRKEGFDIPAHDWFRGCLRPLLRDVLTPQRLRQDGLFVPEAVQQLIQAHEERKRNYGYHLWGILQLTLWMKRWNVTTK